VQWGEEKKPPHTTPQKLFGGAKTALQKKRSPRHYRPKGEGGTKDPYQVRKKGKEEGEGEDQKHPKAPTHEERGQQETGVPYQVRQKTNLSKKG